MLNSSDKLSVILVAPLDARHAAVALAAAASSFVAPERDIVPFDESAADGSVPFAAFARRWHSGEPFAGAPAPVSAAAPAGPSAGRRKDCFVLADIAGPVLRCRYLEQEVA